MFGFRFGRKSFKREIVINAESLETRVAVLENGKLEEFQVDCRPSDQGPHQHQGAPGDGEPEHPRPLSGDVAGQ